MILPLEQQVCSLESAKRLKDLGFPQESLFYYVDMADKRNKVHDNYKPYFILVDYDCAKARKSNTKNDKHPDEQYSAYTVAELGELLPKSYGTLKNHMWHCIELYGVTIKQDSCEETESEARAKMLIYLAENGLINKEVK